MATIYAIWTSNSKSTTLTYLFLRTYLRWIKSNFYATRRSLKNEGIFPPSRFRFGKRKTLLTSGNPFAPFFSSLERTSYYECSRIITLESSELIWMPLLSKTIMVLLKLPAESSKEKFAQREKFDPFIHPSVPFSLFPFSPFPINYTSLIVSL